ncbi:MAG: ABC transporter C-terminal domain-containing protein, partial [Spirochaetales bacterium]
LARSAAAAAPPQQSASWEDEKAKKARYRKMKKREEEILGRLMAVSAEKKALENAMALPANYTDGIKVKKILASITELETEASALNEEWLELADELSALE